MPTFEGLILGAPAGFVEGCFAVNKLCSSDSDKLTTLVEKCLHTSNYVPSDTEDEKYTSIIKVITFLIRCYKTATPKPSYSAMAGVLDGGSFMTRESVENIILAIKSSKQQDDQDAIHVLKVIFFYIRVLDLHRGLDVHSNYFGWAGAFLLSSCYFAFKFTYW